MALQRKTMRVGLYGDQKPKLSGVTESFQCELPDVERGLPRSKARDCVNEIHFVQNPLQWKTGPKATCQSNTGMLYVGFEPKTHAHFSYPSCECTSRANRAPSRGCQTSDAARRSVSSPAAQSCDSAASCW